VGVRGVCIRLVARLTGWKVGVISESDSVVQAEADVVAEVVDREQERVWAAMAAKVEVMA
jgi:transcription antitermination factor NusA-like protein